MQTFLESRGEQLMMSSSKVRSEFRAGDATRFAHPDQILAVAAHELRLPVSHIKGLVSTLRRTDMDVDEDTRLDFLADIENETNRLTHLLECLLDGYSLEDACAPAAHMSSVSPSRVVSSVVGHLGYLAGGERRLMVDPSPELPDLFMDTDAIERVLINLVENALKYSPPDTAVVVGARMTDRGELEFTVDDRGPGVPARDRERIFEPFFRLRRGAEAAAPDEGHGLGLAICQSIVTAHGGTIEVCDRPGGGARFSVRFPADSAVRCPANSVGSPHRGGVQVLAGQ